jgi:hypothetical protein
MSIDRCENVLTAVQSLLVNQPWATSAAQLTPEVDGVTTITVQLADGMTDQDANQHARELCTQLSGQGYDCLVDPAFWGLRTVPTLNLKITTGDVRGGL